MFFADHELARRLERADAAGAVEFVEAHALRHPEIGAAWIDVGDGRVVFAGAESPVTQAIGLGMSGAVTSAEMSRVESFLRTRGAMVQVEVCPLADGSLLDILNVGKYGLAQHSNVLVCLLNEAGAEPAADREINVRTVASAQVAEWSRAIAGGFFGDDEVPPVVYDDIATFFAMPSSTCFLADVGRQVVGGGVVAVHDGVASLFAHGTHPEYRNRGVQSAIIPPSLALARQSGCDVAMACTLPGSVSQRNLERHGFRVAYTRSRMVRGE
ncbi:MAG: hypothetical protein HOP29_07810 [Phycisphaerales bacterium]|nr:hypothetical protein [Phycisphaerales bacterium]